MKNFTKIMSLFLALTLLLCFPAGVSAAPFDEAVIDMDRKGSLVRLSQLLRFLRPLPAVLPEPHRFGGCLHGQHSDSRPGG